MLTVIFTLDYEIHGNGEGAPSELMIEPTRRLLDQFDRHGARLTIMADVAEILKFKEFQEQTGRDEYNYEAIAEQLRDAIRRGHDVQLHLHSSYFNARHEGGRWAQDWSEYNFAGLSPERLDKMVGIGKEYLETLLKPVDPNYECTVFRAANWSVSPSLNVVRALIKQGIKVETSVFKYGRREGLVSFDYSNAESELEPWPVDENDICRRDESGKLIEAPIYCESRWIGVFLTAQRLRRLLMTKGHPIGSIPGAGRTPPRASLGSRFVKKLLMLTKAHAWKADFNQCTGAQLSRALQRASRAHDPEGSQRLPFVLIGHSKLFTVANESSLTCFLQYVVENPRPFQFGTFQSVR